MILKLLTTLSWVLLSNYETWLNSVSGFETFAYGFMFKSALRFSLSAIVSEIAKSGSLFPGFFQFLSPSSMDWTLTKKSRKDDLFQVRFPITGYYLHLPSTSRSWDTMGAHTFAHGPAQARDLILQMSNVRSALHLSFGHKICWMQSIPSGSFGCNGVNSLLRKNNNNNKNKKVEAGEVEKQ